MGTPGGGCRGLSLIVRRPRPTFWNPPGPGTRPGAAEEGVRPGGFDLRTLRKAPSLLADSVRRRPPPLSHPLLSLFLPHQSGGASPPNAFQQTVVEPSWPQEGVSPPGLSVRPHTRHPQNLGFNVYFLIQMPATREPPGGPSVGRGCWKGVFTLSGPHLHPGREIHLPGKAGPPVPPLRVSDRMRVAFFFNLLISFTCSPPAHRA